MSFNFIATPDKFIFTPLSRNSKTGPMPVTYSPSKTCPDACGLKNKNGCYAEGGNTAIHWKNLDKGEWGVEWQDFIDNIKYYCKRKIWRHNVAGDLAGENNSIDAGMLRELVAANKSVKAQGFTYTHKPVGIMGVEFENAMAISEANQNGFTINLSADNMEDADRKANLGIGPVVVVLPSDAPNVSKTPEGRTVLACPAEKSDLTCNDCGACAKSDRKKIIGFRAHGSWKKQVDKRLNDGKKHLAVVD